MPDPIPNLFRVHSEVKALFRRFCRTSVAVITVHDITIKTDCDVSCFP